MIRHIWTALCRESIIDQDTNNISLLNIFERLEVGVNDLDRKIQNKEKIGVPINFEIISLWRRNSQQKDALGDVDIEVLRPDGEVSKKFSYKLEIKDPLVRMRSRFRINGFEVTTSGDYIFRVKIKEDGDKEFKTTAEVPLEVHIIPAAKVPVPVNLS